MFIKLILTAVAVAARIHHILIRILSTMLKVCFTETKVRNIMKIDAIGLEMIVYNDNKDSQNEE